MNGRLDDRIFIGWNKERANRLFTAVHRHYRETLDYQASRLLLHSPNLFNSAKGVVLKVMNSIISCFLPEEDRTYEQVLSLMREYNFNPTLTYLVGRLDCADFERSMSRSSQAWSAAALEVYAAVPLAFYAFN
jgi:hypothetical protein